MRGGLDEGDKLAGLRHARTVLASGTDDATALAVAAFVIAYLGRDHKAALSAIERALSLNPSSATALYFGAVIHASSGNSAAATACANRALRLSPSSTCDDCAARAITLARPFGISGDATGMRCGSFRPARSKTLLEQGRHSPCGCINSHCWFATCDPSVMSVPPWPSSTPENGASRRNDYREKSLDRNTTGRSAWNSSSKNFRDTRSSITSRNRMN